MMADPDDDALDEAFAGIEDEGEVRHFRYQVQDKLSVANLIAATVDAFDGLDILINDIRVSTRGSFLDLSPDEFNAVLTQNVRSVFLLSQQVAKRMIQHRRGDVEGAIVNISSIAAERTVPELLAYSVSCAALDQLTRSMAASLASKGIRVNGVALGSVMTGTLRAALKERAELREEMIKVTPLGRIGDAEEAARSALFLASEQSSFVTGQILAVDGGRSLLDPLTSSMR